MDAIYCTKAGTAEADLVIACDPLVAAKLDTIARCAGPHARRAEHARRAHLEFVSSPTGPSGRGPQPRPEHAVGAEAISRFNAERPRPVNALACHLHQPYHAGLRLANRWILLTKASMRIRHQRRQVPNPRWPSRWGCRTAHDLETTIAGPWCPPTSSAGEEAGSETVEESWSSPRRVLTDYQNAAYAEEHPPLRRAGRPKEASLGKGTGLTQAVARYLFKLMAWLRDE